VVIKEEMRHFDSELQHFLAEIEDEGEDNDRK
jgi:hypothetical protein